MMIMTRVNQSSVGLTNPTPIFLQRREPRHKFASHSSSLSFSFSFSFSVENSLLQKKLLMARANKYSSINFNEIYDKKFNSKSSSSSSATTSSSSQKNHLSTARSHGGMLVLTRPSPKPQPQIQIQPKPTSVVPSLTPSPSLPSSSSSSQIQPIQSSSHDPDQTRFGPESISLRPLGRTGSSISSSSSIVPIIQEKERDPPLPLPLPLPSSSIHKPEPFVPPHLRPGFAGRQERFGPDGQKNQGLRGGGVGGGSREIGGHYGEDGRPKSGGYERIIQRSGGESDQADMMIDRPSSSGNRPNSSGRYGSSYRSSPPPHHY